MSIIVYLLFWLNMGFLAYEDHRTAVDDDEQIGWVPLWACITLVIIAFTHNLLFDNLNNLIAAFSFLIFWVFNVALISILEKKNPIDILGIGDFFLFFGIGFFMDNVVDFSVFLISMGLSALLYKSLRDHHFFPLIPSILVGFIFMEFLPILIPFDRYLYFI